MSADLRALIARSLKYVPDDQLWALVDLVFVHVVPDVNLDDLDDFDDSPERRFLETELRNALMTIPRPPRAQTT